MYSFLDSDFMKEVKKKRDIELAAERKRLLAYDDKSAELNLTMNDQYQRLRFLRELEASKFIAEIKTGSHVTSATFKTCVEYRSV